MQKKDELKRFLEGDAGISPPGDLYLTQSLSSVFRRYVTKYSLVLHYLHCVFFWLGRWRDGLTRPTQRLFGIVFKWKLVELNLSFFGSFITSCLINLQTRKVPDAFQGIGALLGWVPRWPRRHSASVFRISGHPSQVSQSHLGAICSLHACLYMSRLRPYQKSIFFYHPLFSCHHIRHMRALELEVLVHPFRPSIPAPSSFALIPSAVTSSSSSSAAPSTVAPAVAKIQGWRGEGRLGGEMGPVTLLSEVFVLNLKR